MDVVINNLVGYAVTRGEILIMSDGTPWRPLVHVEDISLAFRYVLEAPADLVHNQALNVGSTRENYRVSQLAEMIREVVPGSVVKYASGAGPDSRCYRVDCDRIASLLPGFKPRWTVREGIEQLYSAYKTYGLTADDFLGPRYQRIKTIQRLQSQERLDERLLWIDRKSSAARNTPVVAHLN